MHDGLAHVVMGEQLVCSRGAYSGWHLWDARPELPQEGRLDWLCRCHEMAAVFGVVSECVCKSAAECLELSHCRPAEGRPHASSMGMGQISRRAAQGDNYGIVDTRPHVTIILILRD